MLWTWLLFGALIGFLVSVKRGYSVVASVIGGAVLGPLALLIFASGDKQEDK